VIYAESVSAVLQDRASTIPVENPLRCRPVAGGGWSLTTKHGTRSTLEYAKTGGLQAAHAGSNPDNAPHSEFVDAGGYGDAVDRLD
jgi:alkaline phosphatase D